MSELVDSHFRYIDTSSCQDLTKGDNTMPTREKLTENFKDIDEEALLMDGFDEACIGFSQRINEPVLAVYSYDKMVEVLMTRDGMDYDEASEFIDFNCVGAWIGERTPIIVMSFADYL